MLAKQILSFTDNWINNHHTNRRNINLKNIFNYSEQPLDVSSKHLKLFIATMFQTRYLLCFIRLRYMPMDKCIICNIWHCRIYKETCMHNYCSLPNAEY